MPHKLDPDFIRLKDMLSAMVEIEQFMKQSSLDERVTLLAVAYEIAIIGEAADKLSPELRNKYAHVPWRDTIGMRHRIIHGYGKVSTNRLREVVHKHLPILKAEIQIIMAQSATRR